MELKPCPFCGGEALPIETNLGYGVKCAKSGHLHNVGLYPTPEEAAEAWNRRADNA